VRVPVLVLVLVADAGCCWLLMLVADCWLLIADG